MCETDVVIVHIFICNQPLPYDISKLASQKALIFIVSLKKYIYLFFLVMYENYCICYLR